MINDFLKSIQNNLAGQLSDKTEVSENMLGKVSNEVSNSFKEGLLDQFQSGNVGDIVSLFNKGGDKSPLAGLFLNKTVSNLVSRLGLSETLSKQIASVAVPFVIEKFGALAVSKGKNNEAGLSDLLGDLLQGSVKDKLLGGLGKKFGF